MGIGLALVALVAVYVFAFWVAPMLFRSRRRKLKNAERERLAGRRGWRFAADDPSLLTRWRGDPFHLAGDFRKAFGVVRGTVNGVPFTAFDYQRRARSAGRRGDSYEVVTVWALQLPRALPSLSVMPRSAVARKLRRDSPLTGDVDFDQHVVVEAQTPGFAAALLTPEVTRFVREHKLERWHIEGANLLACREGMTRTTPEQLADTAELLGQLVARFPAGASAAPS